MRSALQTVDISGFFGHLVNFSLGIAPPCYLPGVCPDFSGRFQDIVAGLRPIAQSWAGTLPPLKSFSITKV